MEKQQKGHMCCFCRFPEFSTDYHSLAQKETISSGYCDTVYLGTIGPLIINSLINLKMRKRVRIETKMSKWQMDNEGGILSGGKNQRWKVGATPRFILRPAF